jgi:hypothetical protein
VEFRSKGSEVWMGMVREWGLGLGLGLDDDDDDDLESLVAAVVVVVVSPVVAMVWYRIF